MAVDIRLALTEARRESGEIDSVTPLEHLLEGQDPTGTPGPSPLDPETQDVRQLEATLG